MRKPISLSVIRITVTPVPVDGLLPGVQLNESPPLMMLGLIPLVRAVFIGVPVVIVLVALVVITFIVVLVSSIFVIPLLLWPGSGHHRNRCGNCSSQKKRTEKSVSTLHVGLLWRETHIRRVPLTSVSTPGAPKTDQYCSDVSTENPAIPRLASRPGGRLTFLRLTSYVWRGFDRAPTIYHAGTVCNCVWPLLTSQRRFPSHMIYFF